MAYKYENTVVLILISCHLFLREYEIGKMGYGSVNADVTLIKSQLTV